MFTGLPDYVCHISSRRLNTECSFASDGSMYIPSSIWIMMFFEDYSQCLLPVNTGV